MVLSLCSLSLPHHASCVFLLRFQATAIENIKPSSEKNRQKTKNQPFFFRLPETEKKMRRKKSNFNKVVFL
jgi:hypothetical protein